MRAVHIVFCSIVFAGCSVIVEGKLSDKPATFDAGPDMGLCTADVDCDSECTKSEVCDPGAAGTDIRGCIVMLEADEKACTFGGVENAGRCVMGECLEKVCGDRHVDDPEECDDGMNHIGDDGCNDDCTFECESDAECIDDEECNGLESCTDHSCAPGVPLDDRDICMTGGVMCCMQRCTMTCL
jgi:hypothetical protein